MTADDFRVLALELPGAEEQSHMNHPDFRVGGKIFATIAPDEAWGMVKLNLEQQSSFVAAEPESFEPIPGGWGAKGATKLIFEPANTESVRRALLAAWRNTAPKKIVAQFDGN
jgi:hypothetical protein